MGSRRERVHYFQNVFLITIYRIHTIWNSSTFLRVNITSDEIPASIGEKETLLMSHSLPNLHMTILYSCRSVTDI